jgi:hypothetical protein
VKMAGAGCGGTQPSQCIPPTRTKRPQSRVLRWGSQALVTVPRFRAVGIPVRVAVDDGSGAGKRWYRNRHCHSDTTWWSSAPSTCLAERGMPRHMRARNNEALAAWRNSVQGIAVSQHPSGLGSPSGRGATPATTTGGCAT